MKCILNLGIVQTRTNRNGNSWSRAFAHRRTALPPVPPATRSHNPRALHRRRRSDRPRECVDPPEYLRNLRNLLYDRAPPPLHARRDTRSTRAVTRDPQGAECRHNYGLQQAERPKSFLQPAVHRPMQRGTKKERRISCPVPAGARVALEDVKAKGEGSYGLRRIGYHADGEEHKHRGGLGSGRRAANAGICVS